MNAPPAPELSIVIPAYNEESRLPRGLAKIRDYLARRYPVPGQSEIIVVDDGSRDGTAAIAEEWSRELPSLRLVSNGENRGKGYSVRHGMLEARGRVALLPMPISLPRSRKRTSYSRPSARATMWLLDHAPSTAP